MHTKLRLREIIFQNRCAFILFIHTSYEQPGWNLSKPKQLAKQPFSQGKTSQCRCCYCNYKRSLLLQKSTLNSLGTVKVIH